MIATDPFQGGATWAVLQYVLGLERLGCDVFLIEPIKAAALQPSGASLAQSDNAHCFLQVASDFRLTQRAALLLEGTRETVGLPYGTLLAVARRADALLNISGMLQDAALVESIPTRGYLDLDPAFAQLWHVQGIDMGLDRHTHFITIGQAIGQPDCSVPTCGREWITTGQPVVLDLWPAESAARPAVFTTIANWRAYGSLTHEGVFYGQKAHSLRPLFGLPARTDIGFELALNIHPDEKDDLAALRAGGWQLADPRQCAGTPQRYRHYIQQSWAEFGIAKLGYVVSRCGWFSDRSCCYLASGRPVLAQETGFSRFLPVGAGLLSFGTIDEAVEQIERLAGDYERHARAAREIAETCFDHRRVLPSLLDKLGLPL